MLLIVSQVSALKVRLDVTMNLVIKIVKIAISINWNEITCYQLTLVVPLFK
jgi:hypothetical protein